MSLILVLLLPLVATVLSLLPLGKRLAAIVTLISAITIFVLAVRMSLQVAMGKPVIALAHWIELDGLSALVLLLVTLVGATAALFSWGYIFAHEQEARRIRFYFAHFNLFVFALAAVPVLVEPAFVWIAIEFTAMFSVLLVAFDNTHEALEAAWKYIALMFIGAAIALLGFLILFWAQKNAGDGPYTWEGLRLAAGQMPPTLVRVAFLLILIGFGTKVGIVPLHTWLPDAHSQAPSPVCALLSGVKTTVALYTILRLLPLLPDDWIEGWLQTIGLISVGVAAFLLLQVRDYKRLFAYSTVEHMGIIFVAAGLGGNAGGYGAMLQLLNHGLTKSFCFFAAGAALLVLGTREIAAVRGLVRTSPTAGGALLFGALAIGGAPPFAVFLSEFSIFRAGLMQQHYLVTTLLIVFIIVAFFGILRHVNQMVFGKAAPGVAPNHGVVPFSCALTLILAALPVLVLGVYEPEPLHKLLTLAASSLSNGVLP
jgi:hydrogenase-4 component F